MSFQNLFPDTKFLFISTKLRKFEISYYFSGEKFISDLKFLNLDFLDEYFSVSERGHQHRFF